MKSPTKQPKQRKPGSGGARPGSGRKKKVALLAGPIERIKADIEELAPLIGPSLRELVAGIWIEEADRDGNRRVYQRPPDIRAIQEVINRTSGKVAERIQHSGGITLTLEQLNEIKRRAGN